LEQNRDQDVYLSIGFVLHGHERDLKMVRGLILDGIGAKMDNFGIIHQDPRRDGVRLIYHTISRQNLFIVKEKDWRKIKEKEGESKNEG